MNSRWVGWHAVSSHPPAPSRPSLRSHAPSSPCFDARSMHGLTIRVVSADGRTMIVSPHVADGLATPLLSGMTQVNHQRRHNVLHLPSGAACSVHACGQKLDVMSYYLLPGAPVQRFIQPYRVVLIGPLSPNIPTLVANVATVDTPGTVL